MRVFLALALLLFGSLSAHAQEDESNSRILSYIEDKLSSDDRQIRLRGITGLLASNATLDEITISDKAGVWLTIKDASIIWTRSALLRGRLEIDEMSAGSIEITRTPQSSSTLPTPEAQSFALPELPVSINIGKLDVARLSLGAPLLGEAASFKTTGAMALISGALKSNFEMTRLDGDGGSFRLIAGFEQETRFLEVFLRLSEPAGGLAVNLLGVPNRPAVELGIEGRGPLSGVETDIFLRTDDLQNVEGKLVLAETPGGLGFDAALTGQIEQLVGESAAPFFKGTSRIEAAGGSRDGGGFDLANFDIETASMALTGKAAVNPLGELESLTTRGRIGSQNGMTQLPVSGGNLQVQSVDLALDYGMRDGGAWGGSFITRGLDMDTLEIARADLTVQGTATKGADGRTSQVLTTANGDVSGFTTSDPGLAKALGDAITLEAALDWTKGRPFAINAAQIRGNGIDLSLDGQVDDLVFTGKIRAAIARLAPFSGLFNRRLAGSADLSLEGQIAPLSGTFDLTTSGTSEDLRLGAAQLDGLMDGVTTLAGRLARDETGLRTKNFALRNEQILLTSDGFIASKEADFGFVAEVQDLALLNPELGGALTLVGQAEGEGGQIGLSALLRVAKGSVFDRPLEDFRANFDGGMEGSQLAGNLRASGRLDDAPIDLFAALDVTEAAQSLDNLRFLAGPAQITGNLRALAGRDELEGELHIAARDISTLAALALQEATGALNADVVLKAVPELGQQIEIKADAAQIKLTNGETVTLRTDAAKIDAVVYDALRVPGVIGALSFDGLEAAGILATTGRATASFDGARTIFDLTSTLDIGTQLTMRGALAPTSDGALVELDRFTVNQGDAVLGLQTPGLIRFAGGNLSEVDLALGAGTGQLLAQGAVTDTYDLKITANALPLSALDAVRPDLSLTGAMTGEVTVTGPRDDPQIRFDIDGQGLGSAMLRAADVPGVDLTLDGEMAQNVTSLAAALSGPDDLQSRLGGTYNMTTQALDLAGQLGRFPLAIIDPLAGRIGLRGTLTGDVTVGGTLPDPAAKFDLSGSGISFDLMAQNGVSPFEVSATGRFEDQKIVLPTSRFTSASGANFTLTGEAPLYEPGLDLFLGGKLPLSLLNVPLAASGLRGDGIVDLTLTATGSIETPRTAGRLSLADASLVVPRANLRIDGLSAQGRFDDNRLTITEASARNSGGGTFGASASILLDPDQGLPGEINLTAQNVSYTDGRIATADFDADLNLTGPLMRAPLLSGQVNVETVEVTIPGATGAGPTAFALDLRHANASPAITRTLTRAGGTKGSTTQTSNDSDIRLDINLSAPSRVFVRGRGLDGEAGGELNVSGTLSKPRPVGQLNLIRGRIQLLSQRFDLNSGGIVFDGALIPKLTLRARAITDDVEATFGLDGEVTKPKITLSSVPELPNDEIIARIAFGRPLSELSPLQIAQVASAGAEIAGRDDLSFFSQVRRATGLDDLDFETSEDGATTVRAGKYLRDNVYSSIEADNQGYSKAIINLDINARVKARGEVDNQGNTSLGIFFEKDY